MAFLLDYRLWAVAIFAALELAAGWKVYKMGEKAVQVEFDQYKDQQVLATLAAERAARAKEQTLQTANKKVSDNYEILKTATATAVLSLDNDRMRLQSALAARGTSSDSASKLPADAAPEVGILSGCLNKYEAVAVDADALSDQVKALQDYVNSVVLK
jgi:hypothetical protein